MIRSVMSYSRYMISRILESTEFGADTASDENIKSFDDEKLDEKDVKTPEECGTQCASGSGCCKSEGCTEDSADNGDPDDNVGQGNVAKEEGCCKENHYLDFGSVAEYAVANDTTIIETLNAYIEATEGVDATNLVVCLGEEYKEYERELEKYGVICSTEAVEAVKNYEDVEQGEVKTELPEEEGLGQAVKADKAFINAVDSALNFADDSFEEFVGVDDLVKEAMEEGEIEDEIDAALANLSKEDKVDEKDMITDPGNQAEKDQFAGEEKGDEAGFKSDDDEKHPEVNEVDKDGSFGSKETDPVIEAVEELDNEWDDMF